MTQHTDNPDTANTTLVEHRDYYFEGSVMVFTAAYHLRRGYCCGNGCQHCPYEHEAVARKTR